MNNFKDKVLRYGSYTLMLLAPVVFYGRMLFPHVSTKTFFIYGVSEVLFFVWLYALIVDNSYRLSKRTLLFFLPAVGFVVWMTISGIMAVDPHLALWSSLGRGTGLLTIYHCLALAFVVASLVKRHGMPYVSSLFQWFLSGAFILAISIWLGTEGFKFSANVLQKDAGGGFAGNSTLAAGYLLFAVAIAGFLLASKKLDVKRNIFVVIALISVIFSPVFISLYSLFAGNGALGTARGTLLALGAGILATSVSYVFLSAKKSIKGMSIGIVVLGLLSFSFLWIQLVTPNTYLHTKFTEQARSSRFIFWDIAQKAINERPVFGYGPENYSIAYQTYFNPQILVLENNFEGWNNRAHNIYYELGSTAGYPAIILFCVFLLSILYVGSLSYQKNRINRMQASVLAGLLVAYVVNNIFTFDSNLSLMGLFVVAGILYSLADQNDVKQKSATKEVDIFYRNLAMGSLLILFVVTFAYLVYRPVAKAKLYADTFAAPINKRLDLYPKLLEGSSVGSDWDTSELAFAVYKKYASNPAVVKNDPKILPYAAKDISSLLAYLEKVSETNKNDYRLYISRNFLQNTLTYLTDAPYDKDTANKTLKILDHAKELSPSNPNVYWSIAQVKIWGGDFKGVEEAYRKSIEVAPKSVSSYNLFLQYAQIVGNKKLFDEIMIRAKENIPGYELK